MPGASYWKRVSFCCKYVILVLQKRIIVQKEKILAPEVVMLKAIINLHGQSIKKQEEDEPLTFLKERSCVGGLHVSLLKHL